MFLKINLFSGYYQILLHKDTVYFTTFIIPSGRVESLGVSFEQKMLHVYFKRQGIAFNKISFVNAFHDYLLIFSLNVTRQHKHLKKR